jgi:protein TonB
VNDADKMDNLSRLSNISNPNNSADPLDPRNLNNFDNANQSEGFSDLSTTVSPHQSYLDKVRSKIQFYKIYPKASLALKERGTVKLKVRLEKSGYVQKIEIIESSEFKRLDEAAIKAVVDASPFGEFPPEVKFATWSIIVPMRFEFSN